MNPPSPTKPSLEVQQKPGTLCIASKGRQLGRKFSLLAASPVLCFVVLEIVLRLSGRDKPRVWEPHPELGWQHVAGARQQWTEEGNGWVEINSLGYRDRERRLATSSDAYRIAVFGDSMTEAVQVNLNETFCHLLEESLGRHGIAAEVMNFGVNGYGPIQELLLFRQEFPRFQPDCVLLALFLDNDVADCHPDLTTHQNGPPFVSSFDDAGLRFDFSKAAQSYGQYHIEPIYTLRKHSAVYRLLAAQRTRWTQGSDVQAGTGIPRRYLLYQEPIERLWEEAWGTLERVLLGFTHEASRHQCAFGVVSIPAGHVVNPKVWPRVLAKYPVMSERVWNLEAPDRRLAAFADTHGIQLLQPGADYQRASEGPPTFFGDAGHFTTRGHQIMAQAIEEFLRDSTLLPAGRFRGASVSRN